MPRFAVLTHDHPFPHWDFLLEAGAACRTWRLLAEPGPGRTVPAEAIADHRPHYLTYEGPVGGGRGTIARWDGGTFERLAATDDRVEVALSGERLRGQCVIARRENGWQATFAG
ncbi:MAG TPA: DNA polymerase ligase N-terminal domain-containing protein [Planctomycetaceae bacterium]